jgi:hypothetical protein
MNVMTEMKDQMSRVDATRFIDFDFLDCSQLSLLLLPLYPFTPFPSCRACGSDLDLYLNWSSTMPPKAQCGNPLWLSWMEGNPQLHIV